MIIMSYQVQKSPFLNVDSMMIWYDIVFAISPVYSHQNNVTKIL